MSLRAGGEKMDNNNSKAISYVLIASLLFAFMGLFSKEFRDHGVDSFGVTEVRLLITAVGVGIVMVAYHRDQFRIDRKDVLLFIFLAIAKMLMDRTYFFTLQSDMDVTVALVLQMTMPFFVLIISYFVFKQEITMKKKIALLVGIVGVVVTGGFLTGDFKGGLDSALMAIISGFFYAVYSVGGKVLADRKYSANTVLFYTFGIAAICVAPYAMENNLVPLMDALKEDPFLRIVDILCLGILCSMIPFYLLQKAREYTDATTVAMTSLSGVAFTAIVGALLLDNVPSVMEWVGIAIMMVSLIIINGPTKEQIKRKLEERKN